MPEHPVALLDTSCVIAPPPGLGDVADTAVISTLTVAELAFGLHHEDPIEVAAREERYRLVLSTFVPIPYSVRAARLYGAIAASVRHSGRNPRPRRIDLMIASVAAELDAVLLTRNEVDFAGIGPAVRIVGIP